MNNCIVVTGGAGFIGSNFVHQWISTNSGTVINVDKLTYAGNMMNLASLAGSDKHVFVQGDIVDGELVRGLLAKYEPRAVLHFAAESHVDRSIEGPGEFIRTNVVGTFCLLEEARHYWQTLRGTDREQFRFLHVSTDEVYGSLSPTDPAFSETSPYAPNSPYSASKAGSDHLVRAYFHTYGFPVVTTNCSNNYGPYQFPEKLIPLTILNCVQNKPIPVYGDGMNIRDWLFVEDHCEAIRAVLDSGRLGETYNIGGSSERNNLQVVREVCLLLDELRPLKDAKHDGLITFVKDRPGHDRRYAVDTTKVQNELGWTPRMDFASGMRRTVQWYLNNMEWVHNVTSGAYRDWVNRQYATA